MIDVIIPAYNCCTTLPRTLHSLAAQLDKNFKVAVVDDHSTEDIKSVVDLFKDDLDITYLRNDTNIGCGMSRQTGLDNTSGEYVMFVDADDILMPDTIKLFNQCIKARPDIELFITMFLKESSTAAMSDTFLYAPKDIGTWCHGKLYKREAINRFSIRNDPKFSRWADDSYFNAMCMELFRIKEIPNITYIWTYTATSATNNDLTYDRPKNQIFLEAMLQAYTFVLQFTDSLCTIEPTVSEQKHFVEKFSDAELALFNELTAIKNKHAI